MIFYRALLLIQNMTKTETKAGINVRVLILQREISFKFLYFKLSMVILKFICKTELCGLKTRNTPSFATLLIVRFIINLYDAVKDDILVSSH